MFEGISEQFIVINTKRFEEMRNTNGEQDEAVLKFYEHLIEFQEAYENKTGKKLDQKYIAINQDEQYAEEVWKIIKAACI